MMDPDDKWHYYEKAHPHKGIQIRRPKTVFRKSHLYSQLIENAQPDTSIESKLGKIESAVAPILKKIGAEVLATKKTSMNSREHKIWSEYFVILHRRTIDVYNTNQVLNTIEESVATAIDEIEAIFGPFENGIRERFLSKPKLAELRQNAWANNILAIDGLALKTMKRMGIAVGIAPPNKSFIIGSSPIVRFDNYPKQPLGTDGVELWLPIGKRVAVSPHRLFDSCTVINLCTNQVRKINESIYKKSTSVAAASYELLSSLISSKTSELYINNSYPETS